MKHVLITGGAGFIGSHLCDLFLTKGYAVTAIDNLVTGSRSNIVQAEKNPSFKFIEWDVCRPLPEIKPVSGVLHFACPASPVDFDRIPLEILAVDSVGTMHLVELAKKNQARFILASTSEVYGDPLVHPQEESYWGNVNPIGPRACYDETKRFGEAYVASAHKKLGLNSGIVRIFNTYGPRMRPDDGRVVPELCMQALEDKKLTIHSDGKQTRSFCYVSDLVDGIFKFFESTHFGPVNLGNPTEQKIIEFAETVRTLVNPKLEVSYGPARPDDPKRRCPSITRAKQLINWEPHIDLRTGLEKTIEYFRNEITSRTGS